MHSSRMRTARSLTCPGGVSAFGPGGVSAFGLGGGVCFWSGGWGVVSAFGPGGVCLWSWGVCLWSWGSDSGPGGVVVSQHAPRQTPPPWTEFLTHATENITLPQTSFAGGNKNMTLMSSSHYLNTFCRISFMKHKTYNINLKWKKMMIRIYH